MVFLGYWLPQMYLLLNSAQSYFIWFVWCSIKATYLDILTFSKEIVNSSNSLLQKTLPLYDLFTVTVSGKLMSNEMLLRIILFTELLMSFSPSLHEINPKNIAAKDNRNVLLLIFSIFHFSFSLSFFFATIVRRVNFSSAFWINSSSFKTTCLRSLEVFPPFFPFAACIFSLKVIISLANSVVFLVLTSFDEVSYFVFSSESKADSNSSAM